MNFIKFLSPAKINLGLKVVGKRQDNYHLINSVMCLVSLYDEIEIATSELDSQIFLLDHKQSWLDKEDLAYIAATTLQRLYHVKSGAYIKVKKNIPSGSGLGGGSSNAATVLIALNRLWGLHLSVTELLSIAIKLGCDVPFFVYGKNSLVSGIGDILHEITLPAYYFVLINLNMSICTRSVFEKLNFDPKVSLADYSSDYLIETLENDLTEAAILVEPSLGKHLIELNQTFATTMSGSGSSLYLRFETDSEAKKVAQLLASKYNTCFVRGLEGSPLYV